MKQWYCPQCRIQFRVGSPNGHSERLGCPECRLWFHAGTTNERPTKTTMTVSAEDLANHKAAFKVRPSVHESYEFAA